MWVSRKHADGSSSQVGGSGDNESTLVEDAGISRQSAVNGSRSIGTSVNQTGKEVTHHRAKAREGVGKSAFVGEKLRLRGFFEIALVYLRLVASFT
jgi:hypothetical protein